MTTSDRTTMAMMASGVGIGAAVAFGQATRTAARMEHFGLLKGAAALDIIKGHGAGVALAAAGTATMVGAILLVQGDGDHKSTAATLLLGAGVVTLAGALTLAAGSSSPVSPLRLGMTIGARGVLAGAIAGLAASWVLNEL